MTIEAGDALQVLAAHGYRDLTLVGPLPGGEVGGYLIAFADERRVVLKLEEASQRPRAEQVITLTARLHAVGYPLPIHEAVIEADGTLLLLQQVLPGEPANTLTHAIVDDLVALNRLQGRRGDSDGSWRDYILRTLLEGERGYCLHETLREHSPEMRVLLDRIEEVGRASEQTEFPDGDVVHLDFHHLNMLREDGCVSGVIDWDGCRSGDCAFDVVTLAFSAPWAECESGIDERLCEEVETATSPDVRMAYFAHMSLRLADWSIRHHSPESIAFWLRRADEVLPQ